MTQPELAVHHRTPDSVIILAAALGCIPILALSVFAAQARVDDIDAILFAYYGKMMVAGQQLYIDLWDNKAPGIFWIDALGLWAAGGSYAGIAAACALAAIGSCVLFFLIARRLFNLPVAAVGTVMSALYVNLYYYHVGSNRPSTFYVFFELGVMFFYCRACTTGRSKRLDMAAAGACAVGSLCFRQTVFAATAAILVHQVFLVMTKRGTLGALFNAARWYLTGWVSALAVVILALWWTSDLQEAWHAIVVSNFGYVAESKLSRVLPAFYGWEEHVQVLGLPMIVAAAAVVYEIGVRIYGVARSSEAPPCGGRQRVAAPFALLVAWLPIAVYLALIGPHRALHYYAIALPPLVMLATYGVWLLLRRDDRARTPRFYVILALLWFVYMAVPALKHEVSSANLAHFQRFDERATFRYASTIEAIEKHTEPDDSIFLWGYAPQVYWHTNRPQAQRYILVTLIDQWGVRAQPYLDEAIADLKASPPKAVVVTRREMSIMEQPPADSPIRYGAFADWIRRNYSVPADCENGDVWIRNE